MIALIVLLLAGGAARGEAVPGYVRLHVLADDDGDEAQALKLEVRDAVLARARALLSGCADADEAWEAVREGLQDLEDAARARALAEGYGGGVVAEAGVYDFPDRMYGDTLVPAGRYRAVRVVIGAGEGRNWWCVLYPSLCLPEDARPGEPVRFHSTIADWLRRVFGGEA